MIKIVTNKIRCIFCGDYLESHSVHQLVSCKCGKCFTDGGHEYIRRGYFTDKAEDCFEDLSVYYDTETHKSLTAKELGDRVNQLCPIDDEDIPETTSAFSPTPLEPEELTEAVEAEPEEEEPELEE